MSTRKLKIGLLGCGTVGGGLVDLITRNDSLIRQRTGVQLGITKILVRDLAKERPGVDRTLLTVDPDKVLNNGCDIVVELVGGLEPARTFIQRSLERGKHVVTANKALLALDGFKLIRKAEQRRVRLGFEGSVCGGIPIIRALRNGLVGNRIQRVSGILNGTCNYILTRMTEEHLEFGEALNEAQKKGFAEADPTLDIDGHDATQKLKILTELALNAEIPLESVEVEGIRNITADDVQAAGEFGYVIKHVGTAEVIDGEVSLRARPVLLPKSHLLAGVREENNAVLVQGDAVGEMFFAGKGAGSLPSASAVLSDVVDIACHDGDFSRTISQALNATVRDYEGRHYLRFDVADPSAIGTITAVLERNGVEVSRAAAVWARDRSTAPQVRVFTQTSLRSAIDSSIRDLKTHVGQSLVLACS